MRTKLYVLGAVLGVAPSLLPVVSQLWGSPSQESGQDSRGASRKGRGAGRASPVPHGDNGNTGVAAPPSAAPTEPGGLSHPCELVTLVKVPCDEATATCEYTYWHCPQAVKPLKA
ncbi:hypothetical protein [Hyalangium sp.]|uniref:hypothetical protein n=1 Tax=Hyalangium sp. TaxID=2028555 RepID=UPI002D5B7366|nr:hypothetical protein [Hyalangium sp.]HYI03211.1 hypothetical protein [Hyalangium sp.]